MAGTPALRSISQCRTQNGERPANEAGEVETTYASVMGGNLRMQRPGPRTVRKWRAFQARSHVEVMPHGGRLRVRVPSALRSLPLDIDAVMIMSRGISLVLWTWHPGATSAGFRCPVARSCHRSRARRIRHRRPRPAMPHVQGLRPAGAAALAASRHRGHSKPLANSSWNSKAPRSIVPPATRLSPSRLADGSPPFGVGKPLLRSGEDRVGAS